MKTNRSAPPTTIQYHCDVCEERTNWEWVHDLSPTLWLKKNRRQRKIWTLVLLISGCALALLAAQPVILLCPGKKVNIIGSIIDWVWPSLPQFFGTTWWGYVSIVGGILCAFLLLIIILACMCGIDHTHTNVDQGSLANAGFYACMNEHVLCPDCSGCQHRNEVCETCGGSALVKG